MFDFHWFFNEVQQPDCLGGLCSKKQELILANVGREMFWQ